MKATKKALDQVRKKLWENPEIIGNLFPDEEWEKHQEQGILDQETQDQSYVFILQRIKATTQRKRLFAFTKYAAAASIICVAGWMWWSLPITMPIPQTTAVLVTANKQVTMPTNNWVLETNNSRKVMKIQLPDASVVKLYPEASLKYQQTFNATSRTVYLSGKAYFKVKRNTKKPFSVIAGDLNTTALGTSFTINSREKGQKTAVQLHTGKIVVRPESSSSVFKPIYLSTAESGLIYDRQKQLSTMLTPKLPVVARPVASLTREGSVLIMKNIPLHEVLSLLSDTYQVKIHAEAKEISHITFTGTVDTNLEQIENVLQTIALINNMTIVKEEDQTYSLKKQIINRLSK